MITLKVTEEYPETFRNQASAKLLAILFLKYFITVDKIQAVQSIRPKILGIQKIYYEILGYTEQVVETHCLSVINYHTTQSIWRTNTGYEKLRD